MTRDHKKALAVAVITLIVLMFVTVFRDGTSW
jgi:hypothetical protein